MCTSPPGREHEIFTVWAKEKGVQINQGIGVARISGRGLGVFAQRRIEAGEELVKVPISALLTIGSITGDFIASHKGVTVHGLLASFLAFGPTEQYAPWRSTWPSRTELRDSMPTLWPLNWRQPLYRMGNPRDYDDQFFALPPAIGGRWALPGIVASNSHETGLLHQQESRLKADWAAVTKIYPHASLDDYTYYWLIVNTRSFYCELPHIKIPQARRDRMVLCPFADYFNHEDRGCNVTFDDRGFTFTSDRCYEAGEELHISYGNHSNDFLLVEYGFILNKNKWDSLPVDDLLPESMIGMQARKRLESAGYLGNYTLSGEGVCHRTQVAIRMQTLGVRDWKRFVAGFEVDETDDEAKADAIILSRVVKVYLAEVKHALTCLQEVGEEMLSGPKEILISRWLQIRDLINEAVRNGINPLAEAASLGKDCE